MVSTVRVQPYFYAQALHDIQDTVIPLNSRCMVSRILACLYSATVLCPGRSHTTTHPLYSMQGTAIPLHSRCIVSGYIIPLHSRCMVSKVQPYLYTADVWCLGTLQLYTAAVLSMVQQYLYKVAVLCQGTAIPLHSRCIVSGYIIPLRSLCMSYLYTADVCWVSGHITPLHSRYIVYGTAMPLQSLCMVSRVQPYLYTAVAWCPGCGLRDAPSAASLWGGIASCS